MPQGRPARVQVVLTEDGVTPLLRRNWGVGPAIVSAHGDWGGGALLMGDYDSTGTFIGFNDGDLSDPGAGLRVSKSVQRGKSQELHIALIGATNPNVEIEFVADDSTVIMP